jgi:hypothetical protein
MRRRTLFATIFVILFGLGLFAGKGKESWWDEPYTKWDQVQTVKMFNDSPWVKVQTYSFESVQGAMGQNESKYQFYVRLFSSQPVREAYVRMLQLMNKYDQLSAERKQEFDAKVGGIATADPGDEVIVAVAYACNDPQGTRDLKTWLGTSTAATLSQSAYLYTPASGQIPLKNYFPPEGGVGCRFIFPRTYKGQPILQPTDKELRFEVYIPRIGQNLQVGFKPSAMEYKGKFCY